MKSLSLFAHINFQARLPNGQEFAVKRLFHKTEHTEEQFENEILLVANESSKTCINTFECLDPKITT